MSRDTYVESEHGQMPKGEKMIIQIVEDDHALREGIVLAFQEPGTILIQSASLKAAREAFEKTQPELIILDINLPDGSGYDYLRWVKGRAQVPVLVLTANDMETDEVTGLMLGADDYVTKPFRLAVLRARVIALLRRGRPFGLYEEDEFRFDFERLCFTRKGKEIVLSVNEQRLLKCLVEGRGSVLTRERLIDYLWNGDGEFVDENALSVTVNRLRSKLEEKKDGISYIQTVYGQGYTWRRKKG